MTQLARLVFNLDLSVKVPVDIQSQGTSTRLGVKSGTWAVAFGCPAEVSQAPVWAPTSRSCFAE